MNEIFLTPTPFFFFPIKLGSDQVIMTFQWLELNGVWSFSLSTAQNTPILSGLRLVTNYELILQYGLTVPRGGLILLDTSGRLEQPTLFSLGTQHKLYYAPDWSQV